MLRMRFSPITASPISPMSALSAMFVLSILWKLSLDARRTALGERAHLLDRRHRRVPGERGQERAVRTAQAQRLLVGLAGQQAVDEARREPVPAAHAVEHVQVARR